MLANTWIVLPEVPKPGRLVRPARLASQLALYARIARMKLTIEGLLIEAKVTEDILKTGEGLDIISHGQTTVSLHIYEQLT